MSERPPESLDFEEELRKYAEADPFTPFDIVVTSGDRYRITSQVQLAIGGNTVIAFLPKSGTQFFRKNQIVAVHVNEPLP